MHFMYIYFIFKCIIDLFKGGDKIHMCGTGGSRRGPNPQGVI